MPLIRVSIAALLSLILLTIIVGLWLDAAFGAPAVHAVTAWVWVLFLLLLLSVEAPMRRALLSCLVLATAGELVLTEVCAVYAYRAGFLPAYVPPGHCLLYYLGVTCSRRLPLRSVKGHLPYWVYGFEALLVGLVIWRWRVDELGALSALVVGALVFASKNRALYATMAVLSLLMEFWGTSLAVWTWSSTLGATSLSMWDPPLGVGILYCMLDALVPLFAAGAQQPRAADIGASALGISS